MRGSGRHWVVGSLMVCLSDKCGGQGPGACMSRPEAHAMLSSESFCACCSLPDLVRCWGRHPQRRLPTNPSPCKAPDHGTAAPCRHTNAHCHAPAPQCCSLQPCARTLCTLSCSSAASRCSTLSCSLRSSAVSSRARCTLDPSTLPRVAGADGGVEGPALGSMAARWTGRQAKWAATNVSKGLRCGARYEGC